ncbi:sigma-70 family RNA polymerase sigma factor [Roseibacterium sp. SDUM158017]|uniref:sigma-70 family RNA polymerase sigma factor n=1 Tax=Roseicyclus salinarum TaxID=3036773 RepID=UPI0024153363|nr:sigma-70 family RNA polymerase sigma factor [Roseibacterium sp. SDUM158017]MDG4647668.1 sigma-70 family RNA polymerase sigma factor [Roseibacterium sp. SDUM158017]
MQGKDDIEALIARVSLRDRDAFSALYDATSAKLLGICLRVLNDRGAAEDALQDVYVKIWNRADRYKVTGHSPMTWLITVARNTAIDRLRAAPRETDALDDVAPVAAPGLDGEATAIAASEARRIQSCLAELEADRAAAVRAVYLEGRSYAEMAERNSVPLNTMKTWLRRSLISLRECLSR